MKIWFLGVLFMVSIIMNGQDKKWQYLALGDSYTCGQSVLAKDAWPRQLMQLLKVQGIDVNRFDMLAKTGWRTDELLHSLAEAKLASKYDLITVQIGVNNQFQGKPISKFQQELKVLFELVKAKSDNYTQVIVLSIPDYGYTPVGAGFNQNLISAELAQYNAYTEQLSKKYNFQFVNITNISVQGLVNPTLVAKDGLHPSEQQYSFWVKEVMQQVFEKSPDAFGQGL